MPRSLPTPVLPPADWSSVDDLHRTVAATGGAHPQPHLVGFAGDDLLAIVTLRPFSPGTHHEPVIEAMALLLPMGADRVSLALPARAWSLTDPIPPVTSDDDLRQRVVVQVTVDGHAHDPPATRTHLHPYGATGHDTIEWQLAVDPGAGDGWLCEAMPVMVAARTGLRASADQRTHQFSRLLRRGHTIALTTLGHERLAT